MTLVSCKSVPDLQLLTVQPSWSIIKDLMERMCYPTFVSVEYKVRPTGKWVTDDRRFWLNSFMNVKSKVDINVWIFR